MLWASCFLLIVAGLCITAGHYTRKALRSTKEYHRSVLELAETVKQREKLLAEIAKLQQTPEFQLADWQRTYNELNKNP